MIDPAHHTCYTKTVRKQFLITSYHLRDGALGEIKEVHTWTNRPVWPQGNLSRGEKAPVPETLDFDCWLGPAPKVDYTVASVVPRANKKVKGKEVIEQREAELKSPFFGFNWRGWFDYGCGASGDMGCHAWDNVFWSLAPDYPEYVELLEIIEPGKETFAKQTKFKWGFPAKGQRAEFLMAARGEKPWNFPKSNFAEYAGPLTEVMLLGVLAERIGEVGFKIECDPVNCTVKTKQAAALLSRRYRKGWSI